MNTYKFSAYISSNSRDICDLVDLESENNLANAIEKELKNFCIDKEDLYIYFDVVSLHCVQLVVDTKIDVEDTDEISCILENDIDKYIKSGKALISKVNKFLKENKDLYIPKLECKYTDKFELDKTKTVEYNYLQLSSNFEFDF